MAAELATSLHPAACRHNPASGTRLEANPVPLGLAVRWLQVSWWRLKPVKWKISRDRGRQEGKSVGSETGSERIIE